MIACRQRGQRNVRGVTHTAGGSWHAPDTLALLSPPLPSPPRPQQLAEQSSHLAEARAGLEAALTEASDARDRAEALEAALRRHQDESKTAGGSRAAMTMHVSRLTKESAALKSDNAALKAEAEAANRALVKVGGWR